MKLLVAWVFIASVLRKKAHIPLLIALAPPIILSTIALSIPAASTLVNYIAPESARVLVALREPEYPECYPASMLSATIPGLEGSEVAVLAMDYSSFKKAFHSFLLESRGDAIGASLSLPERLYRELGRPEHLALEIKPGTLLVEYPVAYVHRGVDSVVIVSGFTERAPSLYFCALSKLGALQRALGEVENSLLAHAAAWITVLVSFYVPVIYVASLAVTRRLRSEFKALLAVGLHRRELVLCASLAILAVSALTAVFLYALSAVLLNSAYSILSTVVTLVKPQPRPISVAVVFALLALGYPVMHLAVERSAPLEA